MKTLLFLLAFSAVSFADELEKAFEEIRKNHRQLEGYLVTYESSNQQGKKALIEVGLDRKSSWAFVRFIPLNADESKGPSREIWSTEDGNYILKEAGQIEIFKGVKDLIQQTQDLLKIFVLKEDLDAKPAGLQVWGFLSEEEVVYGISVKTSSPLWLRTPENLLSENEKTVQVEWPGHGEITINRATGLITAQEIEVEGGTRSMKLLNLRINPGKKAIASEMTIDLEGAEKKDLAELGLRQSTLHKFFQEMIEASARDDDGQKRLTDLFAATEDQFVSHLDDLPLEKSPFFKRELLFGFIGRITEHVQDAAIEKGQTVEEIAILRHPKLKKDIEKNVSKTLFARAKPEMRAVYLREMLGKELKARGREQNQVRKQIETFLERVYFRARVRRTLDAYLKQL